MKLRPGLVDLVLVLSAVATLALVARRELQSRQKQVKASEPQEFVSDWLALSARGIRMGSNKAPIQIIEFGDLECSACKRLQGTLDAISKRYADSVAVVFIHFPLPQHRFARISARGLECSEQQGRGGQFMSAVYDYQDSLGLKSWRAIAHLAQVPELDRFESCLTGNGSFARIDDGLDLGNRLRVRGTPTLLVNGWRIPPGASLQAAIDSIVQGKRPYASYAVRRVLNEP
jgi:protein-disulfide isomerase